MQVNAQQRARLIADAYSLGAARFRHRGIDAPSLRAGPTMSATPKGQQRPADAPPPGSGVTVANADQIAAQARDLAAWIGSRRTAPTGSGARAAAPVAGRTAPTGSDAEKARVVAATWATLQARRQAATAPADLDAPNRAYWAVRCGVSV